MCCHNIHLVECFGAIGTFPHAVADTIVDTVLAEEMTAGLQDGILEILPTDGA
jgi:hypothetical protein